MNADHIIELLKEIQHGNRPADSVLMFSDQIINLLEMITTQQVTVPPSGDQRVFIASDLIGDRKALLQRYSDAENLLKIYGHKPLNPLQLIPDGLAYYPAMKICLLALINNCIGIALFPDWSRSKDAQTFFLLASHLGYNVIKL